MKILVCYIYAQWMAKVVSTKDDLWVQIIDKLWGGQCWYCTTTRALLAGVGVGLLSRFDLLGTLLGAGLLALSFGLTWVERNWLCEKANDST